MKKTSRKKVIALLFKNNKKHKKGNLILIYIL